jgi:tetratricopeptide (TPR) repeat protein
MPSTYNGIGTWYYGKQRVHRIKATCTQCSALGELESYDTTLYFVFLMIPILPLKKKRVLDECPTCRAHRVADLDKWEEGKQKAIAEILEKLRQNPDDREVILEALGMSTFFQDQPLFDKLTTLAVDKKDDPEIQAALASGYSYFSDREKAVEGYKNSLRAKDDPEVRRHLAINFLRMGDPDQAEPLLRHVWEAPNEAGIGHVQLLIEAYRSVGRHEEALKVMDQRDAAFPALAQDKDIIEQRRTSEKYRTSGKKVPAMSLADSNRSGYREGSSGKAAIAKYLFPLILLGLLATYIGVAFYKGSNRKVFFVNGLPKQYSVTVNGTEHSLPPEQATPVYVSEGDVEVKVNGLNVQPFQFTVKTDFWGRPFDGTVFVVNPDRAAWLLRQEIIYAENPRPSPKPRFESGKEFYQFPSADYKFEQPPIQMKVKKGREITKSRIDIERIIDAADRVNILMEEQPNPQERIAYLKNLLEIEPNEIIYLNGLISLLNEQEGLDFVKAGLSKRPILLEWHRIYQTTMERLQPKHDLVPEYEALVKEVGTGDAKYLLARVLEDDERAEQLVREGANAQPPSAFSQFSLGYRALARGDFDEACNWLNKAYEAAPRQLNFIRIYRDALWATKQYDKLKALPATFNSPLSDAMDRLKVAVSTGKQEEIDITISQLLTQVNPPQGMNLGGPNPLRESLQLQFQAYVAALRNDEAGFLKSFANQGDEIPYTVALLQGDSERAAKIGNAEKPANTGIARDEMATIMRHCLIYLAALKAGKKELADKEWTALLETLPTHGARERVLTEMLAGRQPFQLKKLETAVMEVELKRVLLVVFAEKFPESKAPILALAEKLDFQKDAISLVLKKLRGKK